MAVDKLFEKILCPVDVDHSLQALEFAIRLTQQNDATLFVLNVAPIPIGAAEVGVPNAEKSPWWELPNRERLDKLAKERLERRVKYESDVLSGEASSRIVQKAAEYGADLIVMATHGRSGVSHFFLGSVAEVVVRQAPCPVLTIRPK